MLDCTLVKQVAISYVCTYFVGTQLAAIISQTNIEKDLDDLRSVLVTLIRVLPCHC